VTLHFEKADPRLLDGLTLIAARAAAVITAVSGPALTHREKPDGSPVTAADEASEAIILDGLERLLPGVPVISEEAASRTRPEAVGDVFLLVDPLDGTRELISGQSEYTVNIALVRDRTPTVGIVAAPAYKLLWRGLIGYGAERLRMSADPHITTERTEITTRARPAQHPVAVTSRFHRDGPTDAYLTRTPELEQVVVGSSLKFCRIAEGAADVYPKLSPMFEWDIAAGHALIEAAGGVMQAPDGRRLVYGREDLRIPAFIASGDAGHPFMA
jgi:3'(2'), 5'-bisphosphate nucleotidase